MDRTGHITEHLSAYLEDLGAVSVPMAHDAWLVFDPDPSDSRRMLGFTAPRDEGERWVVRFCPEVINEATKHLDNDDLAAYLDVVEFTIAREAELLPQRLSTEDRIAAADAHLYDMAPGSLRLLSEVQMRLLDSLSR